MHRLIFYALFVPIVALLSVGKLMAQNPPALTLEMAIEQALRENIEIKNAKLEIVDADYLIVERRAWGLPQISANINFQQYFQVPKQPLPEPFVLLIQSLNPDQEVNREASFFLKNNFSPTVSAETVLFDGTYFVGLQAARAYKKYALREFETKVKQVKESVTDAFLPAVLLRENIQLLEKNI
jgi:outer membrane protein TolC